MITLADQVVDFTVTLVRALNQVGQFDPKSPNFARVRARLFKELGRLQRTQPEIGYMIGPPAVAGGPLEVWVDGTSPQRVELRRIVGPSIGGGFILQLLEYMQQRGLQSLAFVRGLSETEWNTFLEIATAPAGTTLSSRDGERVAHVLLEKKVVNIVLVTALEQPPAHADMSWQVRAAFARLAHDLRTYILLKQGSPAAIVEQSERLVSGMAASFLRKFDVLASLLFQSGTVDKLVQDLPTLRAIRALDLIVRGLPILALHGTTALIWREAGSDLQTLPEGTTVVLRAIAERLLKEPSSRQVDESLRTMCRRKILPIPRLPIELQEWVLAETWVESLQADPGREPPRGSAEINPVRLLQKAARHAFISHLPVQATGILERIKTAFPKAVPEVFDMSTVEAVLAEFPAQGTDRRAILSLLDQGGSTAADSVTAVILEGEAKVRDAAAWILTEMKDRGVAAALRALGQEIENEETARLLLACVRGKAPESAIDAFILQFKHKSPRVRRDALTVLAATSPAAAETFVAQALADPDENVRIRALLLCANSGVGSEKIIPRAIQLVSKDARGAPPQVIRAAIEVVVRRREAGALPIADAEAALCHLAAPIGFFGRLLGQKSPPATVLVTAIIALGRLGTERSTKLLTRLRSSEDPDVAQAARKELEQKGGRQPIAPMPMVDSTVVLLDRKTI